MKVKQILKWFKGRSILSYEIYSIFTHYSNNCYVFSYYYCSIPQVFNFSIYFDW